MHTRTSIIAAITASLIGLLFLIGYLSKKDQLIRDDLQVPTSIRTDAVWVWKSPVEFTNSQIHDLLKYCHENAIGTIYLAIDDYLRISKTNNSMLKNYKITEYNDRAAEFISIASDYSISVHALAGETSWANGAEQKFPLELLDFVTNFNKAHSKPELFEGIQFDIEFYALDDFQNNQLAYATNYLSLVESLIQKINVENETGTYPLKLGLAIPFSWDDDQVVPFVTRYGIEKPLAYHLFDSLNSLPGSYVAIMDYRNFAYGHDGIIDKATNELDYAEKNAPNIDIIIGLDTSNTQPAKTTFYGLGKNQFLQQKGDAQSSFSKYSVFGGMAIHDIDSLMVLN